MGVVDLRKLEDKVNNDDSQQTQRALAEERPASVRTEIKNRESTYHLHPIESDNRPPRGAPIEAPSAYTRFMYPCQVPLSLNGTMSLKRMLTTVVMPPPPMPVPRQDCILHIMNEAITHQQKPSQQPTPPNSSQPHNTYTQSQKSNTQK